MDTVVTSERQQHDRVERLAAGKSGALKDALGNIADPFVVLDELRQLWRGGRITVEQLTAAEQFRNDFAAAGFIALRAAALDSVAVSGRQPRDPLSGDRDAADRIGKIMRRLGAVEKSCAWNVLGCGMRLAEWALRGPATWRSPADVLVATVAAIAELER